MINNTTLSLLINDLNKSCVVWGVGGSYLLQIYDMCADPNDLDLWVQPSDMPKIKTLFKSYDEIETDIPLPKELHFKINYIDIEVDFIACFIIKPNQYRFEFRIEPRHIKMVSLDNGLKIPCTYLEDWYIIYRLLKRDDKANLIRAVFEKKKIPIDEDAINFTVANNGKNIPKYLKKEVANLISSSRQYTLFDYMQT